MPNRAIYGYLGRLEHVTPWKSRRNISCPFTATTVNGHEGHLNLNCKLPYTKLWVFTFPPTPKCVILTHPNTHEEQRINAENIQ